MIAKVKAFTLQGLDALPVEVEAGVYNGLPDLTVVGLPDAVLRESKERVRSAMVNSGFDWPIRRMLVNLAPAHIRKEGSGLDLAVAVSLLKASGQLPELDADALVFAGELSLDGSLRETRGILAAALAMDSWPDKVLAVPMDNQEEALRGTGRVVAIKSLAQLGDHERMRESIQNARNGIRSAEGKKANGADGQGVDEQDTDGQGARNDGDTVYGGDEADKVGMGIRMKQTSGSVQGAGGVLRAGGGRGEPDDAGDIRFGQGAGEDILWNLSMVKGQNKAKRALELAAAGGHHLLLMGPPGSGKSLLARCLQGILPPMKEEEMLEVNRIYSAAGMLGKGNPWISRRPFRSPHAGVTKAGLLGGGVPFRPGEVSLAHRGVLYIDELPEMDRNCVESLRQPLEEGEVTLSRVWGSVTLPAKIQLIASANPCPCGYYGEYPPRCRCLEHEIRRYQNRFSGPLLDRMDMIVTVPRLDVKSLTVDSHEEDSYTVARRVAEVWLRREKEGWPGSAKRGQRGLTQRGGGTPAPAQAEWGDWVQGKDAGMIQPEGVGMVQQEGVGLVQQDGNGLAWLDRSEQMLRGEAGDIEALHRQMSVKSKKWAALAYEKNQLTARGYYRMLLLARTVADLNGEDAIKVASLAEALEYRRM
ncbi:MAG: ATP-binding protein [Clostridiales bacterium]|nr:ATP-binding protein [Clostridiales bacterium]